MRPVCSQYTYPLNSSSLGVLGCSMDEAFTSATGNDKNSRFTSSASYHKTLTSLYFGAQHNDAYHCCDDNQDGFGWLPHDIVFLRALAMRSLTSSSDIPILSIINLACLENFRGNFPTINF